MLVLSWILIGAGGALAFTEHDTLAVVLFTAGISLLGVSLPNL